MKMNVCFEHEGRQVSEAEIVTKVREELKKATKMKDVKTLDLYVKPEENACYYVAGEFSGKVELF